MLIIIYFKKCEKITVMVIFIYSICIVNHTVNIKCSRYESYYRCLDDYMGVAFFYFLFQKLLACVGSMYDC